jgi:enoyl-CoA hydratase/3-hydroxyacyl-CoA dehydrogenase
VKGITDGDLKARPIKTVAVLGGGLMGSGIATATLVAGMDVVLKEVNQKFLDAGIGRIQSNLQTMAKKGRIPEAAAKAAAGRLRGTLSYDSFDSVDLVIEAAIENLKIKQQIFADLERACRKDAILSTNTSTINIELVGAKTQAADRIIGAHFFSPAHLMPLLEIVRSDKTSPQVVLDVMKYGQRIKKTCVVVGNCTGFCVNRVFAPYTQAACILLDAGMDPYLIDKAIAGFGMPMGPFRLSDLVGADIGFHVGKNFLDEKPEQFYPAAIFKLMVEQNILGEKTPSGGFYSFEKNKRAGTPNPKIKPLIEEARKQAKVPPADQLGLSPKEVADFIMFPVINEACRVVEEGFVDKPSDCDISAVLGMGFPAWRGGPLKHGDAVGAKTVLAKLQKWEAAFASSGHGGFFTPCKYLKDRAAAGVELCATEERSKL